MKREIYQKFKTEFRNSSEFVKEDFLKKTETKEEDLDAFLKDNKLYCLSEDKKIIKKNLLVKLKIFKITLKKEDEEKIHEFILKLEKQSGDIYYLRKMALNGHLVFGSDQKEQTFIIDDNEVKVEEMDLEEKKLFSKDHGSHLEGILRAKFGNSIQFQIDGLMSTRRGIYLGLQKFKSIQQIRQIFSKIIKSEKTGDIFTEKETEFMKELIKYHPKVDEKMENFDHFILDFHPKFEDTKCFMVMTKDGVKKDFSYLKCLKEIAKIIK